MPAEYYSNILKDGLDIKRAFLDADSKAAGICPLLVAKITAEFDYDIMDNEIKWVSPVSIGSIRDFMHSLSSAIVRGKL